MTHTLFYLFSTLAIISAIQVIWSKNPVESVLYLVMVFINASGLFLLLEVEYIALIFLIVYVGAIAVLFLFVVMMLAPKMDSLSSSPTESLTFYIPLGMILGGIFLTEIYLLVNGDLVSLNGMENKIPGYNIPVHKNWLSIYDGQTNLESLGQVLYTYYFYYFLLAGFVLLVAMIGGIVLTLQTKAAKLHQESKGQHVFEQLARDSKRALFNLSLSPSSSFSKKLLLNNIL